MLKHAGRSALLQRTLGSGLAAYLRFVRATSRLTIDPPDFFATLDANAPVIVAMWHGEHFLVPFARRQSDAVRVMISRSADGEINAIAAQKLGLGLIRASGAHKRHQVSKRGGARGFIEALKTLRSGVNVALTADVPKVSRVVGPGIIQLARRSGRPIMPVVVATSRTLHLDTWDKAAVSLPFGRMSVAIGPMLYVDADLTDDASEAARRTLQEAMDDTTARAYAAAKAS